MARLRIIAPWLIGVAAAAWLVVHARYISDLSAFLPANPTPLQRQLVDQLRDGAASRLILIALEDGDARVRAQLSTAMAQRLRTAAAFANVANGDSSTAERDRDFLFQHRYLLSNAVTAERFSAAGLQAAIAAALEDLAASTGLLDSLLPHDPTGEMLHVIDALSRSSGPVTQNGVWASSDGRRTLLAAQTAAAGSDTDAQERDVEAIRSAFSAAIAASGPAAAAVRLRMSGPGVFAVAARATIKRAATRLSIVSSLLVIGVLWTVYRSIAALILGLLPVATGALFGIAAVALGFGAVHGLTLGFGITLIGESVDYSIYFFIQSQRSDCQSQSADPRSRRSDPQPRRTDPQSRHLDSQSRRPDASEAAGSSWQRQFWPTIRLGMLTSVCGFASLLPSGFPGLAQLGLYSISGLIAAASVTRCVLPELLPPNLNLRDMAPLGRWLGRRRDGLRARGPRAVALTACLLGAAALAVLYQHRGVLWNRELSALSPVPPQDQRYDATLRADLGAANVLDLVIVSGVSQEAVLQAAERAGAALRPLVDAGTLGGFDSPADYLPSQAAQQSRRDALPAGVVLRDNLRIAAANLDLKESELKPFVEDVEAARRGALLTVRDLRGTSMAAGFDALILKSSGHFTALLPLHAASAAVSPQTASASAPPPTASASASPQNASASAPPPTASASAPPRAAGMSAPDVEIDLARVMAALADAHVEGAAVLDLKAQTDALYRSYLHEAIRLSLAGFGLIVLLLLVELRSVRRMARVLAPLVLAVLSVAAALTVSGRQLNILHLVGMLLIVAVGSNYALFFDNEANRPAADTAPLTLASLGIANLSTVIAFGLLSFSQVPVLEALGETVAPGAFLALVFSALLTPAPRAAPERIQFAA